MKTLKTYLIILLIPLFTITFINCEGKEGPPGVDGIDGVDGKDGKDGNANVRTLNVVPSTLNWTDGSYLGKSVKTTTITSDLINQSIIDNGTVLGYILFANRWLHLPYSTLGTNYEYIGFNFGLNNITLYAYNSYGPVIPSVTSYRFIIITDNTVMSPQSAPGKQTISTRLKNSGVDINNYEQVCKYFGLTP